MSDGRGVRGSAGREPGAAQRAAAERNLPSAGHSPGLHPQAGKQGEAAAGHTRRCETGWCRRRCVTSWNRSSSGTLPSTATASAPDGAARTRCGGWTNCSKRATCYVVDADLKSYFDTIPHERLLARVRQEGRRRARAGADRAFLKPGVLEGLERVDTDARARRKGAVLSPLLSQHLSQSAGPPDGRARGSRWCAMPTTLSSCAAAQAEAERRLALVQELDGIEATA